MLPLSLLLLFQSFLSFLSGFLTLLKILYLSQNPRRCIKKCAGTTLSTAGLSSLMCTKGPLWFFFQDMVSCLRVQVHKNAHAFRNKITEKCPIFPLRKGLWDSCCEWQEINEAFFFLSCSEEVLPGSRNMTLYGRWEEQDAQRKCVHLWVHERNVQYIADFTEILCSRVVFYLNWHGATCLQYQCMFWLHVNLFPNVEDKTGDHAANMSQIYVLMSTSILLFPHSWNEMKAIGNSKCVSFI